MNPSPKCQRHGPLAQPDAQRRVSRKGRRLTVEWALGALTALLLTAWLLAWCTGQWLRVWDVLTEATLVLLALGAFWLLSRRTIQRFEAHRVASREAERNESR